MRPTQFRVRKRIGIALSPSRIKRNRLPHGTELFDAAENQFRESAIILRRRSGICDLLDAVRDKDFDAATVVGGKSGGGSVRAQSERSDRWTRQSRDDAANQRIDGRCCIGDGGKCDRGRWPSDPPVNCLTKVLALIPPDMPQYRWQEPAIAIHAVIDVHGDRFGNAADAMSHPELTLEPAVVVHVGWRLDAEWPLDEETADPRHVMSILNIRSQ